MKKNGFTIVELLVVIGLVGVIVGIVIGSANYYLQQQRSELDSFTREMESLVSYARQRSVAAEVPSACADVDTFSGYGVTFNTTEDVSLTYYCPGPTPTIIQTRNYTNIRYRNIIIMDNLVVRFRKNSGESTLTSTTGVRFQEDRTDKISILCVSPLGKITVYAGSTCL